MKKIRGTIHYFGRWAKRENGKFVRVDGDGWKEALEAYKLVADDLHAGRTPRERADELTVENLLDHFLTAKKRKMEAGELTAASFAEYKAAADLVATQFGLRRLVDDLAAADFAALRAVMAKKWGPVKLANTITRVKSIFKFGTDNGLVEKTVRYGTEFQKPSAAVMRRHRAGKPPRMLEADELRALIDGKTVGAEGENPRTVKPSAALRAMILLGVNCGLGNTDCATLALKHIDLERGWLDFPRPKTGIARRCPLWPETVAALHTALAGRPRPADDEARELVFLTEAGTPMIRTEYRSDRVTKQFIELLRKLSLHRERLAFYALRHTFRTVADAARDPVAIDTIMGHVDSSMGAVYRERIDDARLVAVVGVVHEWLWPTTEEATSNATK